MTFHIFQTAEYRELSKKHIFDTIEYLFAKNQDFAIACQVSYLKFNPELPPSIKDTFDETVIFILSGYTFDSANLEDEFFSFEAGFGSDNFGSTITLPILAIKQLFVKDTPIIMNLASPDVLVSDPSASRKSSMDALLNNPKNKKLLKSKTKS